MGRIRIADITARGSVLKSKISCSRGIRRYFAATEFEAIYDMNIAHVPESVLSIPIISTVAPIAWATDATLEVPSLDSRFAKVLEDVKDGYCRLYPSIFDPDRGNIEIHNSVSSDPVDTSETGLLFSSGVDSQAAFLTHGGDPPVLLLIQGADISRNNEKAWQALRRQATQFADRYHTSVRTIRSNFRELPEYHSLDADFAHELGRVWWGAVHYQTGLPGLCAPISVAYPLSRVFEASGYTDDPKKPGDQPYIVSAMEWSSCKVKMKNVPMTRQEKVGVIASHIDNWESPCMVRSCDEHPAGKNCNCCEKCYRTLVAFAVEGVDPSICGFSARPMAQGIIREQFESGSIQLTKLENEYWNQVQRRARELEPSDTVVPPGFLEWFAKVDLDRFTVERKLGLKKRGLYCLLRNLPSPTNTAVSRFAQYINSRFSGPRP